jgi:hypothetical protein
VLHYREAPRWSERARVERVVTACAPPGPAGRDPVGQTLRDGKPDPLVAALSMRAAEEQFAESSCDADLRDRVQAVVYAYRRGLVT